MEGPAIIELASIDEPDQAARTEISDEGLSELASSIRSLGIINPLSVVRRPNSSRYEVVAGHRRLLAARQVGLLSVPCVIVERGQVEAVKIHENLMREELHPVDEAIHYVALYEANGNDTERVAALVQRSREYVERRISLMAGCREVVQALRMDVIGLGVAEELNRIARPDLAVWYLEHAIRGGCSVAQARRWREEANERARLDALAPPDPNTPTDTAAAPPPEPGAPAAYLGYARPHELSSSREMRTCFYCRQDFEEWKGVRFFTCRECATRHVSPHEEQDIAHGQRRH